MRRSVTRVQAAAAIIAVMLAMGIAWRQPTGVGEYCSSPDGQWTAHISRLSRGTFTGRERYLELRVLGTSTQRPVIRREVRYSDADVVPEYGDRSKRHIEWAADSKAASFTITNGRLLTVAIGGGASTEPLHPSEPAVEIGSEGASSPPAR